MEFKVKQEVTVFRSGVPLRLAIVAKVDQRKITLDDGSQWYGDGSKEWGMGGVRFYTGPMVRPRAEKDEPTILRNKQRDDIRRFDWMLLTDEEVGYIHKVIRKATNRALDIKRGQED